MRQDVSSRRMVAVAAIALAVLVAAFTPTVAVAQQDVQVADGHTGSVDPGREDDEQQQYRLNFSVYPSPRQPGATNGDVRYFAKGLTENIRLHWIVVESQEFNLEKCEAGDTTAFGIDRGNDDPGTNTDESLLTSYKSYSSVQNAIRIGYYKESALAGEPINVNVEDQIVAGQGGCLGTPQQAGWYRISGKINGSTKMDTNTDYTIQAGTQYIYVCDCSSREEAREQLGPPPNEQDGGGGSSQSTPTATGTATATPEPQSTATATATAEPTATARQQTATPTTANPQQDDGTATPRPATETAVSNPQQRSDGEQESQAPRATADQQSVPRTPTIAEGPGFGPVFALGALLGVALLTLRRRR